MLGGFKLDDLIRMVLVVLRDFPIKKCDLFGLVSYINYIPLNKARFFSWCNHLFSKV